MSEAAVRHETSAQARRREDSPRTPGEPQRAHAAMAASIAALLLAGFVLALASLGKHAKTDAAFALDDMNAWRNGDAMRAVDRAIDVPYGAALRRASAAVRYRLFGDLGPQVSEGCPGWLFYTDGLRPRPSAQAQAPAPVALRERIDTMHRYADALRGEGITLIVATVPDKSRVETEALCGLQQDARMTARWDAWRDALASEGIVQADLLGPLTAARPSFYRTDVHWNARGAQAAADALAAVVLPHVGGRGPTRFSVEPVTGVRPRVGDLLELAGLANVPENWRPAVDVEMPETVRAERSGGLLDETPPAQVLLAGSSFSRRGDFADRLGRALGQEVWNVSMDDGRFDRAFASIWALRATWPRSLKVVIWEMSEDALSEPPEQRSEPLAARADQSRRD